jgi:hypothetical protein
MIYVFKTSVRTKIQAKKLKPHIDEILPKAKWNFDLADCDKVLRIDSEANIISPIINLLKKHDFDCQELE